MAEEPDYILNIRGVSECDSSPAESSGTGRKWIGVRFECCGSYTRIYRSQNSKAYEGCCPRCTHST